ncbi:MAG: hypothetical protein ABSD30_06510 [Candidatus Binatus sp.]|jgi:hypothetical protein
MSLAYDATEHVFAALSIDADSPMALLTAYFDEAGTDPAKPAVAVGCYIATCDQWKRFNQDWQWLKEWSGVKDFFIALTKSLFGCMSKRNTGIDRLKLQFIKLSTHSFMPIPYVAGQGL